MASRLGSSAVSLSKARAIETSLRSTSPCWPSWRERRLPDAAAPRACPPSERRHRDRGACQPGCIDGQPRRKAELKRTGIARPRRFEWRFEILGDYHTKSAAVLKRSGALNNLFLRINF